MIWDRDGHCDAGRTSNAKPREDESGTIFAGEDGSTLLLRTSGSLMERRSSQSKRVELNGLMRVIRNYTHRRNEWPFNTSCSNNRTGEFAVADARGQVFVLSPSENTYHSVRLASSPVSCIGFVTARLNELIVAYENGVVLVIDTQKKEIIGNLQHNGNSPVRMIRCHPTKPAAILVNDEKVVSFWSLTKMRSTKSFESDKAIVDIRYEANGSVVAMALKNTGVYIYRSIDLTLMQHCPLPDAERKPAWLAYASHSLVAPRSSSGAPADVRGQKSESQSSDSQLRVMLSADNGMIYVWHVAITHDSLVQRSTAAKNENADSEVQTASLVGVIELPVTMTMAVSLVPMGHARNSTRQARILVMSNEGDIMLVEIEDATLASLGSWTVTMAMSQKVLLGADSISVRPFVVGSKEQLPCENNTEDCVALYDGKVSARGDIFLAIGADKAVRLYDADAALGLGSISGSLLRSRLPYSTSTKRPDYWSQIQNMKASKDTSVMATSLKKSYSSMKSDSHPSSFTGTAKAAQGDAQVSSSNAGPIARPSQSVYDSEDLGPPPPYMSQSLSSLAVSRSGNNQYSNGGIVPAEISSMHPAKAGGDSPKGSDSRQQRLREKELKHKSRDERSAQKEMIRQQRVHDQLDKTEGEMADIAQYQEQLRAHKDAVAAARASRDAEKASRAKVRSDAAAARREAKLARIAKLEAEGISLRATEIFELAALTPAERETNVRKLRGFVDVHGEFPTKYRSLIWRFLLQLPENVDAFEALKNKGTHPSFESLGTTHPMADAALAVRLQALCSQLAYWSPVLGEAQYLPQLVFPLLVQFGHDDLSAFETAASFMMWWGHTWMSAFPSQPSHILETMDALVSMHDSKLKYHMSKVPGITAGELGWTMMSTGLAEVLVKSDWLRLMDFLIANFRHPGYFLLAPVAILRNVKTSLMTTDKGDVMNLFCRRLQGVVIKDVIADMKSMLVSTSSAQLAVLVPRRLTEAGEVDYAERRENVASQNTRDDDDDDDISDLDEGLRSMKNGIPGHTLENGIDAASSDQQAAIFPLPKAASYPSYNCYPIHALESQLRERSHTSALTKELRRKEGMLRALSTKTIEVQAEHDSWMARYGNASDSEAKRRIATMEAEKVHMKELLRMEEAISSQRVDALVVLERVAEEELKVMDSATSHAKTLIDASEAHLDERMTLAMNMARHRELAEQAETSTEDRIRTLQLRRAREERIKSLTGTIKIKEQELDARDALLAEEWKRQDQEMARRRSERLKHAKSLLEDETLGRLQDEMTARMQRLVMEREAKIVEIERNRAVRIAREQTDEAIEAAERSALLMQKQELAMTTEKAAQLAAAGHKMTHDLLLKSAEAIRDESTRLVEAERVYAVRQQKARVAAREATMERDWADKQSRILVGVISSEQELQEQMLRMSRASAETDAEESLIMEQSRIFAQAAAGADGPGRLEALGERVMGQQRSRFEEMKKSLSGAARPRG